MKIVHKFKEIITKVFNLVFPIRCAGCNREDEKLCSSCLEIMLSDQPQKDENGFYLLDYKNPITQKVIWDIKYSGNIEVAKIIGEILYENSLEYLGEELSYFPSEKTPLVIPIPSSKKRIRKNGFNHAGVIASGFCSDNPDFLFTENVLVKILENKPQAKTKSREERMNNIKGAFGIKNPEKISGRLVILIDDVKTTGATLQVASRLLQESGAGKVICITVARG